MKIHQVVIIGLAAWAGYFYYYRYHALMNAADGVLTSETFSSDSNARELTDLEKQNNGGGLGTIGLAQAGTPRNSRLPMQHATAAEIAQKADEIRLMQAASKGDPVEVRKLLESHINANARDDDRRTALMYASSSGQNEICSILLSAGAQARFQDRYGNNAYDYAASSGLNNTVQFLLDQSGATDDNHYIGYASIIHAITIGDVAELPKGDQKLASVNRLTPTNQAPLHLAANSGSLPIVEALINRGADVNLETNTHQTPLQWAAWSNQIPVMNLLISKGADINAHDLGGNTPLMLAAQNNSADAVKLLLEKGANKNVTNRQGKSALIIAQEKGNGTIAALLQ